jgi:hypothetical protein
MKIFLVLALAVLVSCSSSNPADPTDDNTEQNGNNNGGNNGHNNGGNNGNNNGGTDAMPPGSAKSSVRIIRVYPYPYGVENNNETLDIQNFGTTSVSMVGWVVRDNDSTAWELSRLGTLDRDEKAFYKCLAPASMDNEGDTLYLIDNQGDTIQTVTYGAVMPGQFVKP